MVFNVELNFYSLYQVKNKVVLLKIGLGLQGVKPIKESSEVQSIQIGDGDVMRNILLPIYMIFPRW